MTSKGGSLSNECAFNLIRYLSHMSLRILIRSVFKISAVVDNLKFSTGNFGADRGRLGKNMMLDASFVSSMFKFVITVQSLAVVGV